MMNRIIQFLAVVVVSAGFTYSVQAAELVVVASTAPDYKVGMVVDADDPFHVGPGTEVTLISSAGLPVKLVGPFDGVPELSGKKGKTGLAAALSDVIMASQQKASSAGIMRAALFDSGDLWVIDSGQSGSYCIAGGTPVLFWRAITIGEVQASLKSGGQRAQIVWAAGNSKAEWPQDFPLNGGETYQLEFTTTKKLRDYTIHRVPEGLQTDAHKVVWMHAKGCGKQAAILLTRLQEAIKTPDQG